MVAKLKSKLNESFSSLKATLDAIGSLEKQRRQERIEFADAKGNFFGLEVELQKKEAELVKAEEEATTKHKVVVEELAHY